MKALSTYKKISLWLIPPEPILSSLTQTQEQLLAYQNNPLLPSFIPHVTLVGGVPISECCTLDASDVLSSLPSCDDAKNIGAVNGDATDEDYYDEVAAKSVLKRLTCAFRNFGGVDCKFVQERGVFAAKTRRRRKDTSISELDKNDGLNTCNVSEEEEELQWNQSCISILERTEQFIKAVELADQALHVKRDSALNNQDGSSVVHLERYFKPPACEPHYSFVYGNDADFVKSLQPKDSSFSKQSSKNEKSLILECPPNFTCTQIAVVWTYPSTLDGVKQWREIGCFSLVK